MSFGNVYNAQAKLVLRNEAEALAAAKELVNRSHATNWLLFAYSPNSRAEAEMVRSGTGGLDELRALLPADQVRFALFEVVVRERNAAAPSLYDPSKYIFLTWLGPDAPPGVDKARASTDCSQLAEVLKRSGVAIAGFVQYNNTADITYDDAASKVLQLSSAYAAGMPERSKEAAPAGKPAPKRAGKLEFDDSCKPALTELRDSRLRWVMLGYTEEEACRGALRVVGTGTGGASEVAALWRRDRIQYAVMTCEFVPDGVTSAVKQQTFRKTVVVSMLGEDVSPMSRSRSAGNRCDLLDFVNITMPVHVHYQPGEAADLTDASIIAQCERTGK